MTDQARPAAKGLRRALAAPFVALWATATRRPTFGGVIGGGVFWVASLAPTLMPRTVTTQAASSGLCLAIGYGLGTLLACLVRSVLERRGHERFQSKRRRAWHVLAGISALAAVLGALFWVVSQNHQRAALTMDDLAVWTAVPMFVVSLVFAGVFVMIGRGCRWLYRRFARLIARVVPERAAAPVTVLGFVAIVVFVAWPGLRSTFDSWANDSFSVVDSSTSPGTTRPRASTVSGGPGSLVKWADLGRHGRDFVAGATPKSVLVAAPGDTTGVRDPIRVYVGLESAPSNRARATLAVRELERTGAFDRRVLVVVTSTGSGWVDPDAAVALEAMEHGDTAIVSQQYSYLPSWIATLLEPQASGDAASALFEAVYAKWERLPAARRPKLVVFGLSLGSYGTEAEFAGPTFETSIANLTSRTDGALLVGATASNPIWQQATAAREGTSPVWRPIVDDGRIIRFDGRSPTLKGIDRAWRSPRVLFVQHPTDPVTFWDGSWFWAKPPIMDAPRGDAVVARSWFPIVTGIQGVFDLMAGFGAPPGFGHDYRLDYVRAWAQVLQPPGWSDADTEALEAQLHRR